MSLDVETGVGGVEMWDGKSFELEELDRESPTNAAVLPDIPEVISTDNLVAWRQALFSSGPIESGLLAAWQLPKPVYEAWQRAVESFDRPYGLLHEGDFDEQTGGLFTLTLNAITERVLSKVPFARRNDFELEAGQTGSDVSVGPDTIHCDFFEDLVRAYASKKIRVPRGILAIGAGTLMFREAVKIDSPEKLVTMDKADTYFSDWRDRVRPTPIQASSGEVLLLSSSSIHEPPAYNTDIGPRGFVGVEFEMEWPEVSSQ